MPRRPPTATFECSELPTEEASAPDNPNVGLLVPATGGFFAAGDFLQWCGGDPDAGYRCDQFEFGLFDSRFFEIPVDIQGLLVLD